jgi:hypothetical protein
MSQATAAPPASARVQADSMATGKMPLQSWGDPQPNLFQAHPHTLLGGPDCGENVRCSKARAGKDAYVLWRRCTLPHSHIQGSPTLTGGHALEWGMGASRRIRNRQPRAPVLQATAQGNRARRG